MSITLTTGSLVRSEGNYISQITEAQLYPYIDRAHFHVSESINDYNALYNELTGSSPGTRAVKAQKAETFFALGYSIVPLNSRTSPEGGIIKTIGLGDSETQLLSFQEALDYSNYYLDQAQTLMQEIYVTSASLSAGVLESALSQSYISTGNIFYGAI